MELMKMKKIQTSIKFIFIVLIVIQIGCSKDDGENTRQVKNDANKKPVIVVSNYPLFYFTVRLVPEVDVQFPAEDSDDPSYWKPNIDDISIMQNADLIILNGAGYEKWLSTISVPTTKIINSLKGLDEQLIKIDDKVTHSHGLEGEHEHSETAFTTWLDFKLCINQAEAIKDALILLVPSNKEEIEQNFLSLKSDLVSIDTKMQETASNLKDKILYASHPVYQYLSKAYHLNIISEHWEPDEIPSEEMWSGLSDKLENDPSDIMLWEDKPLPEIEKKLNALGVRIAVFNPCANKPETGDFLSVMNSNIEGLIPEHQ
jgi:zinc transport system substrate-binding protein